MRSPAAPIILAAGLSDRRLSAPDRIQSVQPTCKSPETATAVS